ncbi:hypothetical protein HWV62_26867 [Athelia sp. TMB]|nr:hypothetical protein HWV62_26867 [Athelia sp. TMB]
MHFRRLRAFLTSLFSHSAPPMTELSGTDSFFQPLKEQIVPVEFWANNARLPANIVASRASTIISVHFFKSSKVPEHELLELEVAYRTGPQVEPTTAWCLVERGGGVPSTFNSPMNSASSLTLDTNSNSGQSPNVSSVLLADDRAGFAPRGDRTHADQTPNQEHKVLLLPRGSTSPLTILDLAALFCAVSEQAIHYHVIKSNCYWYAGALWTAIERRHHGVITTHTRRNRPGTCGGVRITEAAKTHDSEEVQDAIRSVWDAKIAADSRLLTQEQINAQIRRSAEERHALTKEMLQAERAAAVEKDAALAAALAAKDAALALAADKDKALAEMTKKFMSLTSEQVPAK